MSLYVLLIYMYLHFLFQECDIGYRRTGGGLYLGICEQCNCYGHSTECDTFTGQCRVRTPCSSMLWFKIWQICILYPDIFTGQCEIRKLFSCSDTSKFK